jgi:hypothetical protein
MKAILRNDLSGVAGVANKTFFKDFTLLIPSPYA